MQRVFITGGSRGIGAAAVRSFTAQGWHTGFLYHNADKAASDLAAQTGAAACKGDVADPQQVQAAIRDFTKDGPLDALVCCAGISHWGLISQITPEDWQRLFAVNVDGVFYAVRAALPGMLQAQRGSIVTLSSMWGQRGASCEAAYSATKGAVIALSKALAQELGPSGIRVNCVAPGVIDTAMNAHLGQDIMTDLADRAALGRIGTPEETAQAIYWLASDQARFVTGQVLGVDGGFV